MDQIKEIHVSDFQSIAAQKVSLGERKSGGSLTLIVGPSSTGKSAVLRAVRLLAYNSSLVPVRSGAKKTNVAVTYDSGTVVGVERGKALSTYNINKDKYQKAGVSVPKDVENTLKFYRDTHFAFQFDPPYLLGEKGTMVTQIFGEITNAHVLTEAIREGARRRQESSMLAKTRRGDAEEAAERLKAFEGLDIRQKTLEVLDGVLEALLGWQTEARDLRVLCDKIIKAESELAGLETLKPQDISQEISAARQVLKEADDLRKSLDTIRRKKEDFSSAMQDIENYKKKINDLKQARHDLLHEMGVCPTCGRSTNEQEAV